MYIVCKNDTTLQSSIETRADQRHRGAGPGCDVALERTREPTRQSGSAHVAGGIKLDSRDSAAGEQVAEVGGDPNRLSVLGDVHGTQGVGDREPHGVHGKELSRAYAPARSERDFLGLRHGGIQLATGRQVALGFECQGVRVCVLVV